MQSQVCAERRRMNISNCMLALPGVLKLLAEVNIRNLYLFSYYEYVGEDIEADINRVSADPQMQRWWN